MAQWAPLLSPLVGGVVLAIWGFVPIRRDRRETRDQQTKP